MYYEKYDNDKIVDGIRYALGKSCAADSKEAKIKGEEIQETGRWRSQTNGVTEGL